MSENGYSSAQPRPIGAVLQSAFRIFGATVPVGLFYGAVFAIVQLLPSLYRSIWAPRVFGLRATAPGVWLIYILCGLLTLILFAATHLRQDAVAGGRKSSVGEEIGGACSKLFRLALLTIAGGLLIVAVGEFLLSPARPESLAIRTVAYVLLLATLYWTVASAFAWTAVVLLSCRPFEAVVCSIRLVRSSWLGTFLILLLALILLLVCLAAGQVVSYLWPFTAAGELFGTTAVALLVSIALNATGLPLISALIVARFADLRVREPTTKTVSEGRLASV
jgi:hypothetical protein